MQTKMSYARKKPRRKAWPAIILLLVLVAVGIVLWWHFDHNKMANNLAQPPATNSQGSSSNNPGTSSQSQDNNPNPGSASSSGSSGSTQSNTNSNAGKTQVTPFITTASPVAPNGGNVNINGGIQGVTESGGTCTLTMTKGSTTVTQTKSSFISGQETTCGQISVPYGSGGGKLSTGTWQAVLSYSSSDAYGASSPTSLTIE